MGGFGAPRGPSRFCAGMESMEKITGEIFQVGGEGLSSPEDAAIYLINFGGRAAFVDAGCGGSVERVLANVRALPAPPDGVDYILLTHCHFDHTGGANALREATGARTVAHELDARYLEDGDSEVTAASWYGRRMTAFPVDEKWSGSEREFPLGSGVVHAIHTPGHSPGSAVYWVESEGLKALFGQDVHGPLHPSLLSERSDYIESLRLLLELEADVLCEGHYGVIRGREEVRRFIRRFIDAGLR